MEKYEKLLEEVKTWGWDDDKRVILELKKKCCMLECVKMKVVSEKELMRHEVWVVSPGLLQRTMPNDEAWHKDPLHTRRSWVGANRRWSSTFCTRQQKDNLSMLENMTGYIATLEAKPSKSTGVTSERHEKPTNSSEWCCLARLLHRQGRKI